MKSFYLKFIGPSTGPEGESEHVMETIPECRVPVPQVNDIISVEGKKYRVGFLIHDYVKSIGGDRTPVLLGIEVHVHPFMR